MANGQGGGFDALRRSSTTQPESTEPIGFEALRQRIGLSSATTQPEDDGFLGNVLRGVLAQPVAQAGAGVAEALLRVPTAFANLAAEVGLSAASEITSVTEPIRQALPEPEGAAAEAARLVGRTGTEAAMLLAPGFAVGRLAAKASGIARLAPEEA